MIHFMLIMFSSFSHLRFSFWLNYRALHFAKAGRAQYSLFQNMFSNIYFCYSVLNYTFLLAIISRNSFEFYRYFSCFLLFINKNWEFVSFSGYFDWEVSYHCILTYLDPSDHADNIFLSRNTSMLEFSVAIQKYLFFSQCHDTKL